MVPKYLTSSYFESLHLQFVIESEVVPIMKNDEKIKEISTGNKKKNYLKKIKN